MAGAFQTSRDMFASPIWKNIVEFRLFFLIYGSAVFSEEGYRVTDDLILQRGQWLRSTRKIQEDLEYIENRQVKRYSTSVINRCIKSLVTSQRVCTKTHELGTVFTVVNYDTYQGFGHYKTDDLERNLEQYQNSIGTIEEQHQNNNNKDINVNKEKNNTTTPNTGEMNPFKLFESEGFGTLSQIIGQKIGEFIDTFGERWTCEAMKEAVYYGKRNLPYVKMILETWKTNGVDEPWTVERKQAPQNPKSNVKSFQKNYKNSKPMLAAVANQSTIQRTPEERAAMRKLAIELDGTAPR